MCFGFRFGLKNNILGGAGRVESNLWIETDGSSANLWWMCSFQTTGLNYRWKNPKAFSQSSITSLWTRTLVLSFFHCQSSWSHRVFWKQTGGKVGWTSAGVGQLLRIGFHTVEPLPRLLVTVGLYYCNLINGKVFVGASFNSAIVSMDQKWLPPPAGSWRLLKPSLVGGENNLTGPHPPLQPLWGLP